MHRVICAHQFRYVERLAVANPKQWDRALRLYLSDRKAGRYSFTELFNEGPQELEPDNHRPFDPSDVQATSVILVNERMANPDAAFFRYLWQLLLRSPLDASETM